MTPVCRNNVLSLLVLLFTTKFSGFLYSDLNAKCKPLPVANSDMGKVDNTHVQKKNLLQNFRFICVVHLHWTNEL